MLHYEKETQNRFRNHCRCSFSLSRLSWRAVYLILTLILKLCQILLEKMEAR
ncbi:hypothetical protein [Dipodfec virus UOA04_Rod_495]|nr:hypothetical protein [Dipodfec virus UOA04_Rod_495]